MSLERKIALVRAKAVLVRAKAVLMRVETVLVRVKMAEVLTSEYFDAENRIHSVILESELTVVVREKLCIHPWISIFYRVLLLYGGVERISLLLSIFCTRKSGKQRSKQSGGVRRKST